MCTQKLTTSHAAVVPHRRSIAERGGCFQLRLFVSLLGNTIAYERLNVERLNLAIRCVVQESRTSSNLKVIDPTLGPHTRNVAVCLVTTPKEINKRMWAWQA